MRKSDRKKRRGRKMLPPRQTGWRWKVVCLPGGIRTRLGILANGLFVLVLFALFGWAAVYLLYREQEPGIPSAAVTAPAVPPSLRPSASSEPFGPGSAKRLDRVLAKHVSATGLEDVHSLVLHGRFEENGESHKMQIILRRPDLARMTIDQSGLEVVRAFDGRKVSMGVFAPDGDRVQVPEEVARATGPAFLMAGAFGFLSWNYLDRPEGFLVEASGSGGVDGRECLQVSSRLPGGLRMDHLLEPETGRELARRTVFYLDGEALAVEATASSFERMSGVEVPKHVRITFADETTADVRIESVRVDVGVLPSIFVLE